MGIFWEGNKVSWEETMLGDVLETRSPIGFTYSLPVPTSQQREVASVLSKAEKAELFAFVQWNQKRVRALLAARTSEEFQALQREYVMDFRSRETHYERAPDRINPGRQLVLRAERVPGEKYAREIVRMLMVMPKKRMAGG